MAEYRITRDNVAIAWCRTAKDAARYVWGRARGSHIEIKRHGQWVRLGIGADDTPIT